MRSGAPTQKAQSETRRPEVVDILWTAKGIGRFIRLSADGVYTLSKETDAPIYLSGNRLYAFPEELNAWLRRPENLARRRYPTKPDDSL